MRVSMNVFLITSSRFASDSKPVAAGAVRVEESDSRLDMAARIRSTFEAMVEVSSSSSLRIFVVSRPLALALCALRNFED